MLSINLYGNRNDTGAKIRFCMADESGMNREYVKIQEFPLVEILYQTYELAICDTELINGDCLEAWLDDYKNSHPEFKYSVEDLINLGWIGTNYNHRRIIGHRHHSNNEAFLQTCKKYNDADIFRFAIWMDQHHNYDGQISLKNKEFQNLLKKWREICPGVPKVQWFEDNGYIARSENKVFPCGSGYHESITEAMGRLWDAVCTREGFEKMAKLWEKLAYQVRLSNEVCKFETEG